MPDTISGAPRVIAMRVFAVAGQDSTVEQAHDLHTSLDLGARDDAAAMQS